MVLGFILRRQVCFPKSDSKFVEFFDFYVFPLPIGIFNFSIEKINYLYSDIQLLKEASNIVNTLN